MLSNLIYALIVSFLPISEIRIGLPLAVNYALENNISILLVFFLSLMANILAIFAAFIFLDFINKWLLKINVYKNIFDRLILRIQKKVDVFEEKYNSQGFLALMIFVAVPLPGTGAWTACLIAWLLGLDRKKSIMSIALGVIGAGLIVLLAILGFIKIVL